MILKHSGNVSFKLKEDFPFSWLDDYGEAFCVCDEQDSGNICFGVKAGERRYFVKFAGAPTVEFNGDRAEAILRLRNAAPVYAALSHPNLVKLLNHEAMGGGYVLVFEWAEGECLHAHWDFGKHPKYTHPQSPNYRFRLLPTNNKLVCLDAIFGFHLSVAQKGYVAIDFYDGSIMYDFATGATTICDIDFYCPSPAINDMGRMWGSSRFMSPEEFERGATIDEVTNVFTMGATAFELLGSNKTRSLRDWNAPEALFAVAKKATSPARGDRHPSISEFYAAWKHYSSSCILSE